MERKESLKYGFRQGTRTLLAPSARASIVKAFPTTTPLRDVYSTLRVEFLEEDPTAVQRRLVSVAFYAEP